MSYSRPNPKLTHDLQHFYYNSLIVMLINLCRSQIELKLDAKKFLKIRQEIFS